MGSRKVSSRLVGKPWIGTAPRITEEAAGVEVPTVEDPDVDGWTELGTGTDILLAGIFWLEVTLETEFTFAWFGEFMAEVRDIGAVIPGSEENKEAEGCLEGRCSCT